MSAGSVCECVYVRVCVSMASDAASSITAEFPGLFWTPTIRLAQTVTIPHAKKNGFFFLSSRLNRFLNVTREMLLEAADPRAARTLPLTVFLQLQLRGCVCECGAGGRQPSA